ncbi:LysR family transcriptional regulator [Faunimonas sp. B44]|uniref:LysR family transcriptional regulator n=1 Tax=Faunimonas sp. B44 TaxID=3461493 RepID=UPI004044191E
MVDLRHLSYLIALAEEGTVTAAAERLGIQQPPLTRQLRALEDRVGVPLIHRLPRGVELTEAGKLLVEEGRVLTARLEQALQAARRTARGEQGRIAVGFTSSAGFHPLVPNVIRAFRDKWPGVALALEEWGTVDLVEAIRHERLDIAFVRMPGTTAAGLVLEDVLDEPMLIAVPAGHRLARDIPEVGIPLAALADETFIMYRRSAGPGLHDAVIAACVAAGFSPRVGQETPRTVSTLSLVAAGLGISVVPASMRRMDAGNVLYISIASPGLYAPIQLASRRGEPSRAVRNFREIVRRMAQSAAAGAA